MKLPSAAASLAVSLLTTALGTGAGADTTEPLRVAVAASARAAVSEVAERFEDRTGQEVVVVSGSTGRFFAQIVHGAPFDLFFAAEAARPQRLVEEGLADSLVTYGVGELVFWFPGRSDWLDRELREVLSDRGLRRVALANPRVAPYGAAAVAVIEALDLAIDDRRRVYGEDVGQTLLLVATGAAPAGFVARSQLVESGLKDASDFWIVPSELHPDLDHCAVRVVGSDHPAAASFLSFATSAEGQAIFRRRGFATPTKIAGVE
ncbi:MAG: molybdate ABC transporter substrate-binding protein [Thermoanaerobaculia bacterium]|nr:molybdate ABC transporter substrate-binding protein [Thermoanaerobaculia bacterium]